MSSHPVQPESQLRGVFLAVAAFTCFVLADTCIKAVNAFRLPAYEIIACVAVSEMVLLAGYSLFRGGLRILWPKRPARPLLRSGLDLVNNLCVVIALRHLPLALFYILVFLAPALTTVLEAIFLSEPLGWKRWAAVLIGFAGVVVAVDPFRSTQAGDRVGYLACMVCVACFSASMVWSRRISREESPESLTFFSSLVQGTAGMAMMLGHAAPLAAHAMSLLVTTAVVSVIGSLCFFRALKRTSAATVSQYHYTQLLTGALLAYLIWREKPTVFMLGGAVLIVVSGWLAARIARGMPTAQPEL